MIEGASPLTQAFLGTLFTWGATAFGAAAVFVVPRSMHPKSEKALLDICLGFAGGVMLAASYWSLLEPAFEYAAQLGWSNGSDGSCPLTWVPVAVGFLAGALFVFAADLMLPNEAALLRAVVTNAEAAADNSSSAGDIAGTGKAADTPALPAPAAATDATATGDAAADSVSVSARAERSNARARARAADPSPVRAKSRSQSRPRSVSQSRAGASLRARTGARARARTAAAAAAAAAAADADADAGTAASAPAPVAASSATGSVLTPAQAASARVLARSWRRVLLLIAAITVHNFPEGLAVGVGFGSLPTSSSAAGVAGGSAAVTADAHKAFSAARSLAIGIGLQNIPEGLAVSLPLLRLGRGRLFSFFLGQLSGLFEVFAGLLGAAAVNLSTSVLPSSMAFAAGAMVFVVAEQLIPEANSGDSDHGDDSDHDHGHGDCGARVPRQGRFCAAVSRMRGGTLASLGLTVGFVVMMVMDVTL